MTLQKFIPEKPLSVTVRIDGRFSFNSSASRFLDSLKVRRLTLFGDTKTKQVALERADPKDHTALLVTFTRHNDENLRASLEGRAFLEWIGYRCDQPRRFLLKKDDSRLIFTIKPQSGAATSTRTPAKPKGSRRSK